MLESQMTGQDEALYAQQQVARLQALLEAARTINSTIALDHVLKTVLHVVCRELELNGAFFTHFPYSYGDVPPALLAEEQIRVPQVSPLRPGIEAATIPPLTTQDNLLRFPLHDKAGVAFTELVVLHPADRVLSLDELDFLESLAIQSATAIENARFHERTVQWQRLESDLESARAVQRSLLPQKMPEIPGYSLAMRSVTCYAVGGDYLDIVSMPNGITTIVVADVAGKGLASALVSVSFRSAFRAMVNSGIPLLEIATRMNLLHNGEGEESRRRYVTAIFLQLDPANDTIDVVNAGHNPAFLVQACLPGDVAQTPQKIHASGTPVGLIPYSTYKIEKFPLPKGARLLLYTDGLTEVFHGEEEFGEERLLHSFQDCTSNTPEQILDTLWSELDAFCDQEQSDDMTALVLQRQA
jgi:serine phosphatase RsbU (regulator of sigma subunit)